MVRRAEYLDHLAATPLFSTCSERELELIARRATSLRVEPGHRLAEEGAMGYEFFVILEGEAAVERGGVVINTLLEGDFFGELALLDRAPRNATVRALTDMRLMVLGRGDFEAVLLEAPPMALKLLAGMARRLRLSDLSAPAAT
jgi:CRP-like cAMP-binding protein